MRLLHAGCGREALPLPYAGEEVRLDVDPKVSPDIVADLRDLGDIGPFDVVYCSHALEHLYPHEVPQALAGFHRVLWARGLAIVFVPDLEGVAPTGEMLFESEAGPVAGLDLFYGLRKDLAQNPHMAHHTGFVAATLEAAMREAGFADVNVKRLPFHNLMATGRKT